MDGADEVIGGWSGDSMVMVEFLRRRRLKIEREDAKRSNLIKHYFFK